MKRLKKTTRERRRKWQESYVYSGILYRRRNSTTFDNERNNFLLTVCVCILEAGRGGTAGFSAGFFVEGTACGRGGGGRETGSDFT